MTTTQCPTCSAANATGRKFCGQCGTSLLASPPACGQCGTPFEDAERFCGECGSPRAVPTQRGTGEGATAEPAPGGPPQRSGAELRLVSVLFVDLVGYTALAETRDAEDVRELLSTYFDTARTIVGRYGGTVEKFIGDAVMAVWGSPVAREDDAERAVRAALDLVAAVPSLGSAAGVDLAARAGIVTGTAAAIVDPREGLVVGDRVNTAARVQSEARPGTVLVDDVTRRATQAAVSYVDADLHEVKGKTEPLHLWQAMRIVAGVRGVQRVDGLEAGFTGRDTDLSLVKAMLHDSVDRGVCRLVTVAGQAGVGKSRLVWEVYKYVDGLADTVHWHQGRCLSYGEGVAYWALAEMVRQRFGIAEEDPSEDVARKMAASLALYVGDEAERDFLAPRVGRLLGIDEGSGLGREELFSGWRLLLERLSEVHPVMLVVEDAQWADPGLLDFLEHLLDWSSQHPIFVLVLTRPDLFDRRPQWSAGRRNATTTYLEPLLPAAVDHMLDDLVPGMPRAVRERIVAQSEGIPLYAVETIRSLIDLDLVVPRGGSYALVGDLDRLNALEVPATLASLIAARLDALPADARTLVRDLSIFRGSFPLAAVSAVSQLAPAATRALLADLVQRDVLTVRADPLSPQRGQYAFAQAMLRSVAYDTLAKRERKTLHLAAATHLREAFPDDGDEIIDVIAAHYLEALEASPGDADTADLRRRAHTAHLRAAERAERLGAPESAFHAFETAAGLSDDERVRADLLERAADMARARLLSQDCLRLVAAAADAHEAAGRTREAAALRGRAALWVGSVPEAVVVLREAMTVLGDGPRDAAYARVVERLARALSVHGENDESLQLVETALAVGEALELTNVISDALVTKGTLLQAMGREREATGLYSLALTLAREDGESYQVLNAYINLTDALLGSDRGGLMQHARDGLELCRRLGDREAEQVLVSNLWLHQLFVGEWDAVETDAAARADAGEDFPDVHARLMLLLAWRGDAAGAAAHAEDVERLLGLAVQDQLIARAALGAACLAAGDFDNALRHVKDPALSVRMGLRSETYRIGWPVAVEAALGAGRLDDARRLVDVVRDSPPGHVPPYLRGQLARLTALMPDAEQQGVPVEARLREAVEAFTALGHTYWRARAQLDLGEWLVAADRPDEASSLLAGAEQELRRLRATTWADRAVAAAGGRSTAGAAAATVIRG